MGNVMVPATVSTVVGVFNILVPAVPDHTAIPEAVDDIGPATPVAAPVAPE